MLLIFQKIQNYNLLQHSAMVNSTHPHFSFPPLITSLRNSFTHSIRHYLIDICYTWPKTLNSNTITYTKKIEHRHVNILILMAMLLKASTMQFYSFLYQFWINKIFDCTYTLCLIKAMFDFLTIMKFPKTQLCIGKHCVTWRHSDALWTRIYLKKIHMDTILNFTLFTYYVFTNSTSRGLNLLTRLTVEF